MIAGKGSPSLYSAYGPAIRREPLTTEHVSSYVSQLDQWIERHPGLCIAAAVTAGVALGWLIKRR